MNDQQAFTGQAAPRLLGARRSDRRRFAFREAGWIALIALFTTALALGIVYLQTISTVQNQMRGIVERELDTLLDSYQQASREAGPAAGRAAAAELIGRATRNGRSGNDYVYMLVDPAGVRLAGNLTRWPSGMPSDGWASFRLTLSSLQGSYTRQIDAHSIDLPGGDRLLVGHLAEGRLRIRDRFLEAMGLAVLLCGGFALLAGYWRSRRVVGFVGVVNDTGARFLSGEMGERLPLTGANDEYDRLAMTVNAAFEATQHMVESLRAVTDGMAHDLKTPLTRIRARLELARLREEVPPSIDELLADTDRDLATLLKLIDGMLRLARAEATSAQSFVSVDLAALARDVVDLYEPVAEDKGVRLTLAAAPAPARGSPALLSQLMANLIDNAVKYTPAGGIVRVATDPRGGARFTVADTGPGIPAADRARVLTRFVRLDASRNTPGVGLGLSLVDTIARVHGATLTLGDNRPGLQVEVRFPA